LEEKNGEFQIQPLQVLRHGIVIKSQEC